MKRPSKSFIKKLFEGRFSCGGLNVRQVPTSKHRKSDVELCKVFSMMVNRWTSDKVKEMHIIRQRGCPKQKGTLVVPVVELLQICLEELCNLLKQMITCV